MGEVMNMEEVRVTEVPTGHTGGEIMDAFTARFRCAQPVGAGVRLRSGGGWVTVTPQTGSVRIRAEGDSAEIAEELCGFYERELREIEEEK